MSRTSATAWVVATCGVLGCSDGGGAAIDAAPDAPVDAAPDAPVDASPDAPPDPGGRSSYVVSRIDLPANAAEATAVGLDIDDRPNDANNGIDNQLGMVLANLQAIAPALSAEDATAAALDRGRLILLADLFADDLTSSATASLQLGGGANPQPPACADANDQVCRRHLVGTASFTRAGAPGMPLPGRIQAGRFTGGPGTFSLPLAFFDGTVTAVPLQRARAELTGLSATAFAGGKVGGAVQRTDFDTMVVPSIHAGIVARYDADCPPPRSPPGCHCTQGSAGVSLQNLFDSNDDCTITLAEVQGFFGGLVTSDIDLDGDGVNDAVSIGVGVQGVRGAFPAP